MFSSPSGLGHASSNQQSSRNLGLVSSSSLRLTQHGGSQILSSHKMSHLTLGKTSRDASPHGSSANLSFLGGGAQSKAAFVGLLNQYRSRATGGAPTAASQTTGDGGDAVMKDVGVAELETNIVNHAVSRLGSYQQFRAAADEKYKAKQAVLEHHRSELASSKLEEAQYEIKSLRQKLVRRNETIGDLRKQVILAAQAQAASVHSSAVAAAPVSAAGAGVRLGEPPTLGTPSPRSEAGDGLSAQRQFAIDVQNGDFLAVMDKLDKATLQLEKAQQEIERLSLARDRDEKDHNDALFRGEQREMQLFDRLVRHERETILAQSTTAHKIAQAEKLELRLDEALQELLDTQHRLTDLEGQLQAAQREGEHLAAELAPLQKKLEEAEEEKAFAVERERQNMEAVAAEKKDDLRVRYEALVKELDNLVKVGLRSQQAVGRSATEEAEEEHGISFDLGNSTSPRPDSPSTSIGAALKGAVGKGPSTTVNMHRRALDGTQANKKNTIARGKMTDEMAFDENEENEEEEDEDDGGRRGATEKNIYMKLQESEDKFAKEKVKVSILTKENVSMQQENKRLQENLAKETRGIQMMREMFAAKENAWGIQKANLQKDIARIFNEKRELMVRNEMLLNTLSTSMQFGRGTAVTSMGVGTLPSPSSTKINRSPSFSGSVTTGNFVAALTASMSTRSMSGAIRTLASDEEGRTTPPPGNGDFIASGMIRKESFLAGTSSVNQFTLPKHLLPTTSATNVSNDEAPSTTLSSKTIPNTESATTSRSSFTEVASGFSAAINALKSINDLSASTQGLFIPNEIEDDGSFKPILPQRRLSGNASEERRRVSAINRTLQALKMEALDEGSGGSGESTPVRRDSNPNNAELKLDSDQGGMYMSPSLVKMLKAEGLASTFMISEAIQTDASEGAVHATTETAINDCELPLEESIVRIFKALRLLTRQQLPTQADFLLPLPQHFSSAPAQQLRNHYPTEASDASKPFSSLTAAEATWRLRRALLYVNSCNALRNVMVREIAAVPVWSSGSSRMFVRCLDMILQAVHILLNPAASGEAQAGMFAEVRQVVGSIDEEIEAESGTYDQAPRGGSPATRPGEATSATLPEPPLPAIFSALPAVEGFTGSPRGLIKIRVPVKARHPGISFTSATRERRQGVDDLLSGNDVGGIASPEFTAEDADVAETTQLRLFEAQQEARRLGVDYNQVMLWALANSEEEEQRGGGGGGGGGGVTTTKSRPSKRQPLESLFGPHRPADALSGEKVLFARGGGPNSTAESSPIDIAPAAAPSEGEYTEHVFKSRWELGKELGKGAFGHVTMATNRKDPQWVAAVKIFDKVNMKPENIRAAKHEAEIMRKLQHRNIVHFVDFFDENDHSYLVLEYLSGGELFTGLVAREHYSEKDARDLVFVLFSAVKHMHDHDVVHRDLKPENLIMTTNDNDADVKIGDFGFAAFAPEPTLTDSCGSPAYVAPEVLNRVPYGKAADMWSLGVITYCLLGGYPPFPGPDLKALFRQIQTANYEFHADHWDEVSDKAKDFISSLLMLDPEARMTADQALLHPWLKMAESDLIVKLLTKAMTNFKTFNAGKKIKGAAKAIMAAGRMRRLLGGVMAASKEEAAAAAAADVVASTELIAESKPEFDVIVIDEESEASAAASTINFAAVSHEVTDDRTLTSSILGDSWHDDESAPLSIRVFDDESLLRQEELQHTAQMSGRNNAGRKEAPFPSSIESDFAFRRALGHPADARRAQQAQFADLVKRQVQWNKAAQNGIFVADPKRDLDRHLGEGSVHSGAKVDLYFGHGARSEDVDDYQNSEYFETSRTLENRNVFRQADMGYPTARTAEIPDPKLFPTYFLQPGAAAQTQLAFAPASMPGGSSPQRPKHPPSSANVALRHARETRGGEKEVKTTHDDEACGQRSVSAKNAPAGPSFLPNHDLLALGRGGTFAATAHVPPVGTVTAAPKFITRRVVTANSGHPQGVVLDGSRGLPKDAPLPTLDVLDSRPLLGKGAR